MPAIHAKNAYYCTSTSKMLTRPSSPPEASHLLFGLNATLMMNLSLVSIDATCSQDETQDETEAVIATKTHTRNRTKGTPVSARRFENTQTRNALHRNAPHREFFFHAGCFWRVAGRRNTDSCEYGGGRSQPVNTALQRRGLLVVSQHGGHHVRSFSCAKKNKRQGTSINRICIGNNTFPMDPVSARHSP